MTPRSLVLRLTVLQQVMALALIAAFASLAIWISAGTLERRETQYLTAAAGKVATSLEQEWSEEGDLGRAAAAVFEEAVPPDVWVDVLDAKGNRVASTASGDRRAGGKDTRTLRIAVARGATVVVSLSTRSRHDAVSALLLALLLAALPLLAASLFAGRVLARRALAPLSRLTAEAEGAAALAAPRTLTDPADPDEIVTLSAAFDRLLARVHDMLRAEKNFSQDAAHELRTPLTVLSGEIEMALADPALSERNRRGLGHAAEQARAMSELVEALLLLRRADLATAGNAAEFAAVDLGELVRDAAEDALRGLPERGADLRVDAPDGVVARGNATLLAAAVRNLLANALKFTDPGQRVSIALASSADTASIVVEDAGPGVAPADRERIFDPFFRGGEARAHRAGVGLGLPIILRVARAHGGDVGVSESALGGARFELRLPLRRPA